jgi:hypothetical protein
VKTQSLKNKVGEFIEFTLIKLSNGRPTIIKAYSNTKSGAVFIRNSLMTQPPPNYSLKRMII